MNTMKRIGMGLVALALVVGFSFTASAEKKTESAASKPINEKCANNGKPINPEKTISVDVGFCCNNCKGKFDKDPAAYLEKVAKAADGKCPLSGEAVGDAKSTLTIGFCCGNCQGGAKKDPKAAVAKLAEATKKSSK